MKYGRFYFKGGLIITGVLADVEVKYNPHMKDHPVAVKIIPLEQIWTGNIHIITHSSVRFALWDLEQVTLVEDYLCEESRTRVALTVRENPKRFYSYWKSVARRLEKLIERS